MNSTTLDSPRNARRTYTCVKHVFLSRTRFCNVRYNDVHFTVEARRGLFLSLLEFARRLPKLYAALASDWHSTLLL